ncbi:MAG TPA: hypothetical protein PK808_08915 [Polymorphobacter sp.]|nr:hypothetical protein [Polymorphobacter sp.]
MSGNFGRRLVAVAAGATALATLATPARADEVLSEDARLAAQLSNPVAALISVPFQGNWDSGGGPDGKGSRYTLNIQPVIPIDISTDWNLISRTILPFITQSHITPGPATGQTGFGDTTQSLFLSPKAPAGGWLIWGAGPAFLIPTGTSAPLTSGKWAAGPTAVALTQKDGWTVGILANQLWSFAGDANRGKVSAMFVQPFVSFTTKSFTTYGINTETTCNWELTGNQCAVPINVTVGQLMKIGDQRVSFTAGGRYYVSRPAGTAEWGLRFVATFLFPTGAK